MFKTRRISEYVAEIDTPKVGNAGWQYKILAMFDQHFDSDKCRKDLLEGGLKKAVKGGHPIIFGGDMLDVMQSRHDPRRSRGENLSNNAKYLNYITDECAEFLKPYAEYVIAWFMGNHETSVLRNNDYDIVHAIVRKLKDSTGAQIHQMNYSGYLLVNFNYGKRSNNGKRIIWVHHGYGGNAPVTKGTTHVIRRASAYPDADVLVTGHTHDCWTMPHAQETLTQMGVINKRIQWHLQVPSLKDETRKKKGAGWGVEKGFTPQANGYGWIVFERVVQSGKVNVVPVTPQLELEYVSGQ